MDGYFILHKNGVQEFRTDLLENLENLPHVMVTDFEFRPDMNVTVDYENGTYNITYDNNFENMQNEALVETAQERIQSIFDSV